MRRGEAAQLKVKPQEAAAQISDIRGKLLPLVRVISAPQHNQNSLGLKVWQTKRNAPTKSVVAWFQVGSATAVTTVKMRLILIRRPYVRVAIQDVSDRFGENLKGRKVHGGFSTG